MGFPVGYSELPLPRLLISAVCLLGLVRDLIECLLCVVGLTGFLEADPAWTNSPDPVVPESHSVTAMLIREILPVVRFADVVAAGGCDAGESCAVCLYELEASDEIRRLSNCRHVFHRACLDRWMDHDQRTCPLCRTCFVTDELLDSLQDRLWAVTGHGVSPEFAGDHSARPTWT